MRDNRTNNRVFERWNFNDRIRTIADVDGNGQMDLIGISTEGIHVSRYDDFLEVFD